MQSRTLAAVFVALAVLTASAFAARGPLAERALRLLLARNVGVDATASLPDGLHVILCGSGSPLPDPERAGPCTAVLAGRSLFVIDAGSGGARNLLRMRVPIGATRSVLLTHFHSDHLDGLGELGMLRWVTAANREPLPVLGPAGVERVVAGFNLAYAADAGYRTAHHGPEVAPPGGQGLLARPFDAPADGTPVPVWEDDGVRIAAFTVDHRPVKPSVGYRIEYGGRALVVGGDTRKSRVVLERARGADLLVHEGLCAELVGQLESAARAAGVAPMARVFHDIPDYHTTPREAAETAAAAGVPALLLTHVVPPLPGLEAVYLRGVRAAFAGRVVVGRDGTLASLPSGSREILFRDLL